MIRPLRIVIPGGSGQVGSALARHFQAAGHHVIVLTRSPFAAPWQTVHWDGLTEGSFTQGSLTEGSWTETLNGADVVINLAGRSVNCRYNLRNRTEIYNSRILTTRLLGQVFSRLASPPRLWMNASTATIYRHSIDQPMDEASGELGGYELVSPGLFGRPRRAPDTWNFSISVAKDWEAEFFTTFDAQHTQSRPAQRYHPLPHTGQRLRSLPQSCSLQPRRPTGQRSPVRQLDS